MLDNIKKLFKNEANIVSEEIYYEYVKTPWIKTTYDDGHISYKKIDDIIGILPNLKEEEKANEEKKMTNDNKKEKKDEVIAYIDSNLSLKPKVESFCKCYGFDKDLVPEISLTQYAYAFIDDEEKFLLQNDSQRKFIVFNNDSYKEVNFDDEEINGEVKLLQKATGGVYAIAGDKELVIKFIKYLNKNF